MKYIELTSELAYDEVRNLVKELLSLYSQQKIGNIKIIYTEFVNNLTFTPHCKQLLPVSKEMQAELKGTATQTYLGFEPNADVVLSGLIPMYLQSVVYGYLVESVTS